MVWRWSGCALTCALVMGSMGCGGGGAPAPSVTETEFCTRAPERWCLWLTTCRGFASCDDWNGGRDPFCGATQDPAVRALGAFAFDGEAAAACLAQLEADLLSCDGPAFPGCEAFVPQLAAGAACFPDILLSRDSCAGGYCDDSDATCPGTCREFAALGSSCAATRCSEDAQCLDDVCVALGNEGASCERVSCRDGLSCRGFGASAVCRDTSALDEECDETHPCAGTLYCISGTCQDRSPDGSRCLEDAHCAASEFCHLTGGAEGACRARAAVGTPCDLSESWLTCVSGAICQFEVGANVGTDPRVCVALAGADEPCAYFGCVDGYYCRYPEDMEGMPEAARCAAIGGLDDPCDGLAQGHDTPRCSEGLTCSAGTCSMPGALGDPCNLAEPSFTCASGFCDAATLECTAPRTEGGACTSNASCASTLFCGAAAGNGDRVCEPRRASGRLCAGLDLPCEAGLQCADDALGVLRCQDPLERLCLPR